MVSIAPLVMLKHIHQYFLSIKSMLGIHTPFVPVSVSDFNFVFSNPQLKLNAILFVASMIIIFGFKNTNELAPKYVRSKSRLLTVLLVILFTVCTLSITKRSEFIYFNF